MHQLFESTEGPYHTITKICMMSLTERYPAPVYLIALVKNVR